MSLFDSPQASAPPAPPPVEYTNYRDETAGTQANWVTNPDGTKTLVTSQLPLTPEQQAYDDKLKSIADDSLQWINKLSTNYDRSQIPWLDQYLKDYEATAVQGADKTSAARADSEERTLARSGQADSTAAIKAREQRGSDYNATRTQITRDMSGIEQGARQTELGNANSLYSLATGRMDTQLAQLADSLGRGQQFQIADAGMNQNRNMAMYNGQLQADQINSQNASNKFSNLASLAGLAAMTAGGPAGWGTLAATAFGRK